MATCQVCGYSLTKNAPVCARCAHAGRNRSVRLGGPLAPQTAKPCQVRHEGEWYRGTLMSWQRAAQGWRGLVRYTVAPGMQHLRWVDEGNLRRGIG